MAGILHLSSGNSTSLQGPGQVNYCPVGVAAVGNFAAEAKCQVAWRSAGIFSNLYVRVVANSLSTANTTVQLNKNTVGSLVNLGVGFGVTGEFQDAIHTAANNAGDSMDYLLNVAVGGTGTISFGTIGIQWAATSGTVTRLVASRNVNYVAAAATTFNSLAGAQGNSVATESQAQYTSRLTGTLKNLQVNVGANTRTDTNTLRIRKNTANGNQVISILTTTTGIFEDTVNTDAIVSGDLINYSMVTGADGAHSMTIGGMSVELSTGQLGQSIAMSGSKAADNANLTFYDAIEGLRTSDATESNVQTLANFFYTARNMVVNVISNGVTATSTVTFRKNAANGNQALSIGSGVTGLVEDTVNVDTVLPTDKINYQTVLGATGTTANIGFIAHTVTVLVPLITEMSQPYREMPKVVCY